MKNIHLSSLMPTQFWANIGSGIDLLLRDTKSIPEPMFLILQVLWLSPESNFTVSVQVTIPYNEVNVVIVLSRYRMVVLNYVIHYGSLLLREPASLWLKNNDEQRGHSQRLAYHGKKRNLVTHTYISHWNGSSLVQVMVRCLFGVEKSLELTKTFVTWARDKFQ